MPSATFHHTVSVDAPRDAVWDSLQQPDMWRSVGPVQELWDPTVEDGVLTGFQWSTNVGGMVYNGTGVAIDQERPDHYSLVLDTSEMAGTITVDLTDANPGGTVLDVTVELQSKGLLSSLFFPVVSGAIGAGLGAQIQDMAERLGS
jgi:carbon monoxide dehydrogenase subunit G